jgi:hypothetical protein
MIILYIITAILLMIWQAQRDTAKTNASDNNPYNTVKTDKWKRAHGLIK